MHFNKIMIWAALSAPIVTSAQQSYTIKGSVSSIKEPVKAFLTYKVNGERKIDSTIIKNGKNLIPLKEA